MSYIDIGLLSLAEIVGDFGYKEFANKGGVYNFSIGTFFIFLICCIDAENAPAAIAKSLGKMPSRYDPYPSGSTCVVADGMALDVLGIGGPEGIVVPTTAFIAGDDNAEFNPEPENIG